MEQEYTIKESVLGQLDYAKFCINLYSLHGNGRHLMPKSDHKYHNQSQEYEQNYQLRKHGLRQTKENRDLLDKITSPYSKNANMGILIQKNLKKFEKA